MALKDVLKKIGGVVTGVASTLVKGIPIVGTVASGVLSNVSQKLLASPTPQKESAAALQQQLPPAPSTPVKASSLALQMGIAPVASTPVKQASYDLTGDTPPANTSGQSTIKTSSSLTSLVKESPPVKKAKDLLDNLNGAKDKAQTGLYILIGAVVVLFGIIMVAFNRKGRRR
jgi:hypothetical protein